MSKASEWRAAGQAAARKETVELALPSGMKILARRPDAMQVAVWGRLPQSLVSAALDGEGAGDIRQRVDGREFLDLANLMRDVLCYCCVEPRVSLDPRGAEEIHPREIPMEDVRFLFSWAMRGEEARALSGFRSDGPDAGAGVDGAPVRDTPKRVALDY